MALCLGLLGVPVNTFATIANVAEDDFPEQYPATNSSWYPWLEEPSAEIANSVMDAALALTYTYYSGYDMGNYFLLYKSGAAFLGRTYTQYHNSAALKFNAPHFKNQTLSKPLDLIQIELIKRGSQALQAKTGYNTIAKNYDFLTHWFLSDQPNVIAGKCYAGRTTPEECLNIISNDSLNDFYVHLSIKTLAKILSTFGIKTSISNTVAGLPPWLAETHLAAFPIILDFLTLSYLFDRTMTTLGLVKAHFKRPPLQSHIPSFDFEPEYQEFMRTIRRGGTPVPAGLTRNASSEFINDFNFMHIPPELMMTHMSGPDILDKFTSFFAVNINGENTYIPFYLVLFNGYLHHFVY